MAANTAGYTKRRFTGMPQSDMVEVINEVNQIAGTWVASNGGTGNFSLNATQASNIAFIAAINGTLQRIVASGGTANAIVGTVTTNTTAAYVITLSEGGTLSNIMSATFTTLTGFTAPSVPVSNAILDIILVCATATAFNGGTNSFGDAAYTVSNYNAAFLSGICLTTENLGAGAAG